MIKWPYNLQHSITREGTTYVVTEKFANCPTTTWRVSTLEKAERMVNDRRITLVGIAEIVNEKARETD